jgi:2-polyprenyl-6-methoxyphenol hydroxylase-like FAD-dependent oxidoreductase
MTTTSDVDILIVGAGPTGLSLCAQLCSFGVRARIIDRALDRAHESRALGVQARTLELLQTLGLGDALVARGNPSAQLVLHVEGHVAAEVELGRFAGTDTRYPFVLFVSQAETERLLGDHLAAQGVAIERGVDLIDFAPNADTIDCALRRGDGRTEAIRVRYLVGCDGAHSTVRRGAGIAFEGDAYLQDFLLGDVEADASPDASFVLNALHPFVGRHGIAIFFPLGRPATWRVIAMSSGAAKTTRTSASAADKPLTSELSLEELQTVVDGATGGGVALRDPVWLAHFHLHHRQAAHYRRGSTFLAGDAAHIHSPVGAQGMNTGIQDAWNLGWKLALVTKGLATPRLLDSYEAERWPVGRTLLRYTDRIFDVLVRSLSDSALVSWIRRRVAATVVPEVLTSKRLRAFGFRFISELGIRYRRSPAVTEAAPRLKTGPRAGDRLPDACLTLDGETVWLQEAVVGPGLTLVLCGDAETWDAARLTGQAALHSGLLRIVHLTRRPARGALVDERGEAFARLGVEDTGQYLVRPDGYVGFRCAGRDLDALERYLAERYPAGAQSDRDREAVR